MKFIKFLSLTILISAVSIYSCENELELPESGSIPDATPPSASFTFSGGETIDDFLDFQFANLSSGATGYEWDFGDGSNSTEFEPTHTFPAEGNYTVTLEVSDDLGVISVFSEEIEIIEPDPLAVPDPVLINFEFDKLPKSSGSDCSCAGWINTSIGEQGESSSGNGGSDNVIKFDNAEPDHAYQEFEVTPNADYTIAVVVQHRNIETGNFPSSLELRILAGAGYVDGYTPIYYTDTVEFPQNNWGYTSVSQVEDPANNLMVEEIENPDNDDYITYVFTFNSGANNSVALFIRGIGNADPPEDPADFAMYGYASGEEEIRVDNVIITANE